MKMRSWLPLMIVPALLAQAACGGEDETPPPAGQPGGAPAPKPAAAPAGGGKQLTPMAKVEDRVTDPVEKASIRHQFRDTDFAPDQTVGQTTNRDPFVSFVLLQPGMAGGSTTKPDIVKTPKCQRQDQFVASNYTYSDLRLVGIVTQGTQRRVLMMDPGNLGHIIRRNDCVGKEKAVVKDIGTGYVTFVIDSTDGGAVGEEHSVPLYPNQTPVSSSPDLPESGSPAGMPVVAPPTAPAPKGSVAPAVELPRKN
jgi:Tfp pilus assembly protein PilP